MGEKRCYVTQKKGFRVIIRLGRVENTTFTFQLLKTGDCHVFRLLTHTHTQTNNNNNKQIRVLRLSRSKALNERTNEKGKFLLF